MEVENSTFSKGLEKVRQLIVQVFENNKVRASWNAEFEDALRVFTTAGQKISETAQAVWPLIEEAWGSFTSLSTTNLDPIYSIGNFLRSVLDPVILSKFFENLHLKISNILSFSISGVNRDSFLELFKQENRQNSLKAARFLLGLTVDGNTSFKSHHNVFNYLLVKWMDEPEKVTKKFKRLSDTINKWSGKFKGQASGGETDASNQGHVYELGVDTL